MKSDLQVNVKLASQLLNQIIEKAEFDDAIFKREMIAQHKGEKSIGEGWMLFHLKALREIINKLD